MSSHLDVGTKVAGHTHLKLPSVLKHSLKPLQLCVFSWHSFISVTMCISSIGVWNNTHTHTHTQNITGTPQLRRVWGSVARFAFAFFGIVFDTHGVFAVFFAYAIHRCHVKNHAHKKKNQITTTRANKYKHVPGIGKELHHQKQTCHVQTVPGLVRYMPHNHPLPCNTSGGGGDSAHATQFAFWPSAFRLPRIFISCART